MSQSTSLHEPQLALPHVICERCGTRMRLTQIIPDLADRYEIRFACKCGFDYQMSATVSDESRRQ
jgi:hypothetical protein